MQRKTIGSFIAVLRKANGLTQKDLAEKLNVSDKTVSRWERDEGAPELSLIPVISEIFSITSDELLRGERLAVTELQGAAEGRKTEKQFARLLAAGLSRYKSQSLIAAGLEICGFIAAMLCNFVFLRAYLGFFIGGAFFTCAIIAQLICINHAFLSVADTDLNIAQTGTYKLAVIILAEKIIALGLALFAATLPLLLAANTYAGLSGEYLLPSGLLCAAAALAVCAVLIHIINNGLLKKAVLILDEKQAVCYKKNYRLRQLCGGALAVLLLITAMLHALLAGGDTASFAEGTVFNDYASFQAFMAQDIPADARADYPAAPEPVENAPKEYRDENGNIITEEKALTRQITNTKGETVCEYIWRNKSVVSISYSSTRPDMLPIKAVTYLQLREAQNKISLINACFWAVYVIQILSAAAVYLFKRARA